MISRRQLDQRRSQVLRTSHCDATPQGDCRVKKFLVLDGTKVAKHLQKNWNYEQVRAILIDHCNNFHFRKDVCDKNREEKEQTGQPVARGRKRTTTCPTGPNATPMILHKFVNPHDFDSTLTNMSQRQQFSPQRQEPSPVLSLGCEFPQRALALAPQNPRN